MGWKTLKAGELAGKEIFLMEVVKFILKSYVNGIYAV